MAANGNNISKPDDKTMENFLSKVDEVGSLIKDMSSGNPEVEKSAFEKADKLLGNEMENDLQKSMTGFDKSAINKYSDNKSSKQLGKNGLNFTEGSVSPEEFMKGVEEDSVERQKKRATNEHKATRMKERGNIAFKNGDYETAVQCYSNAIDSHNDNTFYYTNRAQAYIKLKKYELALEDCTIALKLNNKCVKAYVHQGRALQNMNRFNEAIESFQTICKIDKRHKELAEGYINEVNEIKSNYEKIQKLSRLSQCGDENSIKITNTVNKLRRENLPIRELVELISLLKDLIVDDIYKTLFRTAGGFQIIFENPNLSRIFKSSPQQSDEENCVYETTELFSLACTDNDDNIMEVLNPSFLSYVEKYLSSLSAPKIRISMLCLVHKISQSTKGRLFILKDNTKARKILDDLMSLLAHGGETSIVAVGAINNLALCDNIDNELLDCLRNKFLPFVVQMMEILCECEQETPLSNSMLKIMPTSLSTIGNLSKDRNYRSDLANNKAIWNTCAKLLSLYEMHLNNQQKKDTLCSLLGFLMNLTSTNVSLDTKTAVKFHNSCISFLDNKVPIITERSSGLLNHLISACPELTKHVIKMETYKSFVPVLIGNNEEAKNYIIKCIAVCTSNSTELANDLIKKNAIQSLLDLTTSDNANAAGNAALSIANCAKDDRFSATIATTDVIQTLLYLATNEKFQSKVKHNAAIAIGRLASSDSRHLDKLRELHGLEILHEVLQANKDE